MKSEELNQLIETMEQIRLEMENKTIECTPCTTEELKEKIGKKIKKARELQKLEQQTLAEKAGLAQIVVSQAENGKRNLTLKTLCQIADGLNCNIIIEFVAKDK